MRKPVTQLCACVVRDFDTLHPNTTPKHYTLVGFFIFFISLGTCPRLCSSTRNVDCAAPFPLLCRGGPILNSGLKILIPTKTTRKAATMRFVVSPCVLDCIKGSYMGVFGDSTSTTSFLNFNLDFTNVPLAVH